MTVNIPRWLAEQFEADPRSFIPYVGHISGNAVALTCGAVMAQMMVDGRAGFELHAPSMRNGDQDRINTLLRTLSDVDTTVCIDLVRHQSVPVAPQPKARSSFFQMRTKIIFPDANLNEDGLRKMKLSEPAIRLLKTDMTMGNARRFLLWRSAEPVIVEFDLTGLPQLPILSGRPGTIMLMDRIKAELPQGADRSVVVDEFLRRLENTKRAA